MRKDYSIAAIFILVISIGFLVYFGYNSNRENGAIYTPVNSTTGVVSDESCMQCHDQTEGYSEYHNPKLIGCVVCHLGNASTTDKDDSHLGMVLIPGNLNDAEATCGTCHPEELSKIQNSLMTSNSGLIAVDKFIFGEAANPDMHYHIKDLENSPADKHIRDLCANCHLSAEKEAYGPITELSRGGGCNACHLNYSEEAEKQLNTYLTSNKEELPQFHPSVDIFVSNTHCYGCHSRSARISTNYEGWQETLYDELPIESDALFKEAMDKRIYEYRGNDIHHQKGMLCIDCHSSHEVMGDGQQYAHAEQGVKISCQDCHYKESPETMPYDSLDVESLKVFLHRGYTHVDKEVIKVKKSGHPLVNTYIDSLNNVYLIGKKEGQLHPVNPQGKQCARDDVHSAMSCSTCHSSWTSKCIGCHNQYDPNESEAFDLLDRKYTQGQWKEYVAEFSASLPALGVRETQEEKHIEPAIPGMILTIDKGSYTGEENTIMSFHRLYAPNAPHTTIQTSRNCKSCHSNSYALGYGEGILEYNKENAKGVWQFTPAYEKNSNDGLPEDAWIPFLKEDDPERIKSTRSDFRPFSVPEQQQLLMVGSCLECHADESDVMQQSLEKGIDFMIKLTTSACILPDFE